MCMWRQALRRRRLLLPGQRRLWPVAVEAGARCFRLHEAKSPTYSGLGRHPAQVAESHQRTKVDTSGTAKAVVQSLNKMGLPFEEVGGRVGGWGTRCVRVWGGCPGSGGVGAPAL